MKISPHTVGHYAQLQGIISLMKNIFEAHNRLGGRYHILTPSYIWRKMVLAEFSDITPNPEEAQGSLFQLDFVKPITQPPLMKMRPNVKEKLRDHAEKWGRRGT